MCGELVAVNAVQMYPMNVTNHTMLIPSEVTNKGVGWGEQQPVGAKGKQHRCGARDGKGKHNIGAVEHGMEVKHRNVLRM